jgi:proteasome lid subunit RPN8/RPN11
MKRIVEQPKGNDLRMKCEAARQIRQHARASNKAEVCGVLVGSENGNVTSVEASIPGANAVQGGTHVTFTQDTWEHIYRIKDRDYPEARIVGWYHSHPGFGVFLSDHDTFIHKNFFSAPRQVAWVYDPHSDEEGCFGWVEERLERLSRIVFVDEKGGERAGETGKPEPLLLDCEDNDPDFKAVSNSSPSEAQAALKSAISVFSHLVVLLIGFFVCWFLFPHFVLVPVDPRTGEPMLSAPSDVTGGYQSGTNAEKSNKPAPQPTNPGPTSQGAKGKQ